MKNKKVIKDIVYSSKNDKSTDLAMIVDGKDLVDMNRNAAIYILEQYGLIKNDCIIIPKDADFIDKKEFGGATQYTFKNGDCEIIVDLAFDNEDEYIK